MVSRGADGVVAVAQGQAWRAAAPRRVDGNPTGAGDALAAALARGLAQETGWPDRLRDGVATSAAAVAVHQGGGFDAALRESLLAEIDVEEL